MLFLINILMALERVVDFMTDPAKLFSWMFSDNFEEKSKIFPLSFVGGSLYF